MKKLLAMILVLPLILTGCQTVPASPTTGETTAPPQETTSPPMSETWTMMEYRAPLEGCYAFYYDSHYDDNRDDPYYEKIDKSQLAEGNLYAYHASLDACILIAEQLHRRWNFATTRDHIYYTLKAEPGRVYRSDYFGMERTLVYEGSSDYVHSFSYFGTDPNGKLVLIDGRRAMLVDIATGNAEVLVEREEGLRHFTISYGESGYYYRVTTQTGKTWHYFVNSGIWEDITETTKIPETTAPPQETTSPPMSETWTMLRQMDDYRKRPERCYAFRYDDYYDKYPSRNPYYDKIDKSQLVKGNLYVYHTSLDACVLIAEQIGYDKFETQDHIYYTLEAEPGRVYRSDYFGREQTLLYEASGDYVDSVKYWGTDPNGKLTLCDGPRIILVDIVTGNTEVLLEREENLHYFDIGYNDVSGFFFVWREQGDIWCLFDTDEEPRKFYG